MSDSFWAVFGCGILTGIIMTLVITILTKGEDTDGEHDKRFNDIDNDLRVYVPVRCRRRCGDKRGDKQMDKITSEELAEILRTISTTAGVDECEKDYMQEAAERLEKLDRLEKWMRGHYE